MDRTEPDQARPVRRSAVTFKARRRALSPARQALFAGWMQRWGVDDSGDVLDWYEIFGRHGDVVLDIGFGHGESTLALASNDPVVDVVGVEIHTPGVAALLEAIDANGLTNVRVVHGDALAFLDRVGPATLAGVQIFFPDPWPKVRHHHRRIVGHDVVGAITDRLRPGGTLHLATDITDYAVAMAQACDDECRLDGGVVERPSTRSFTRFERRGVDEGRSIVDLRYRRTC